ncbi:MAG: sulfatase-like hydrolase/transferase [Anaerolineae bacterium]|nr:MAG: sulfatase-like hydrolase/transferase [Anaerolineae bacterium]
MERPNILLLYTDQQRWDALGANGNPDVQTPNLDRLAAEGLNLDRFFVQNAVCMPSRVSMLTGLYPSTLGILRNGVPVPEDTVALPHLLRNYGYTSANIGKLHFLPHANRDHRDAHPEYGFDHLEISDEPGCYEDAYRAWVSRKAPEQLDRVSVGLPPATKVWQETMGIDDGICHPEQRFPKEAIPFAGRSDLTHSSFVAEQTMAFLRSHRAGPFFCIAGFYSPHSPWVAPQEFIDLYDPDTLTVPAFPPEVEARRSGAASSDAGAFSDRELGVARQGYYAMVSEVDHHVGRILHCLDELRLAENTIVVYTSDHGEWLGEHLRYGKGYPGHDCVTRVPFILRWPEGLANPGRTAHALVEAVDLVPTLLECAGIPIPYHLQGRSFLALAEGAAYAARTSALTEMAGWKTVRTDRFRYVTEADGRESLYDLSNDPGAYYNVAGDPDYASTLAEMRHELLRRLLERERPLPRVWPY